MTNGEKAIENLLTIKQILEKAKMNPTFNDVALIYKLAEVKNDRDI